jgi:hypothetical protein
MNQLENCIQRVTQSATADPRHHVKRVIAGDKPYVKADNESAGDLIHRVRLATGCKQVVVCFD